MRRSIRTLVAGSACAVLITACGTDEADDGGTADAWRPDPAVPTEVGPDGFTPPDAVLSPGDTASVPWLKEGSFDAPDVTGALEVTVTDDPIAGSMDDLPTDSPFADEREGTPYYVTFTVKNVGKTSLEGLLVRLTGVDVEGADLDSSALSELAECPGGIPLSFAPGESATACSVVFVEDAALAAVGYEGAADYEDDPALWDLT
ncbi:hypothetical protein ncot_12965 [Nocardioides sp. JQ2195]|uniref:hypothetical protein n=1 Tax=Nocardioides sp. JQ2195 TaxID=2592334 RepID=UPI00143EAAEE|nr:hypothetical protein [Nocardioides sp. JQ2195]QIX27413.1 hypothetical protein ncot_12965 [Nocardioides sp. JQ2195]